MLEQQADVVVIGAGAAGLMCAIHAAYRGRKVIIIEKAKKPGRKILMSGGGRCNFTNLDVSPKNFISQNPLFCVSALKRFTAQNFVDWVERHDIPYAEKSPGQLFCEKSSSDILSMLLIEAEWAGVEIQYQITVSDISIDAGVVRILSDEINFTSSYVVIATGGLSIPTMGSSGFGYEVAKKFGLPVVSTRAGLVPLTLTAEDKQNLSSLAGISFDAHVSYQKEQFNEPVLITHRGLSGPAILQISNYWREGKEIHLNVVKASFIDDMKQARQDHPNMNVETFLAKKLPKRLANMWCRQKLFTGVLQDYSNQRVQDLYETLSRWLIYPAGTEGYKTAEVTLGGVDTSFISSKTFAVKSIPQLVFIGEVLDVTGHLGGYNFQWAWSSGFCAAQHV